MNSGYQLGIGADDTNDDLPHLIICWPGWAQATIRKGLRSSSATSYLAPQFIGRSNLHVLLNAQVTHVLQTSTEAFRTVEFAQDLNGPRFNLTAVKEIVLSAGSIGTPNILLHSGIGNSSTLTSLGIQPLVNLPSVGQNLSDHALLSVSFLVNSTDTYDTAERNATLAAEQLAQWNTTRSGPYVDNPLSQMNWLRVSGLAGQFPDPAAGPNTAHYELIVSNELFGFPLPTGNYLSVVPAVVSPTTRGSVMLNSNDSLADPVINPNLLGSEVDLFIMQEALRSSLCFTSAPAWAGYVISPVGIDFNSNEPELDNFIQANSGTMFYPVGTASMSPKSATWGVVDPDLRVKGLRGLRIVDLSVVPFIPTAHTQAATYIIEERAAD
ncbi:hypothetical protein B0H17DRAFT_1132569 [Mycena rosella]|uniref:Glucose-methanol-choline oxidoreductase N-terminal domain-containing protein n=1 Tax=Mycena rosella TaxID=1033263 RepID=A0AAD7GGE6_MYCRO|nr:hypothetical protein B0H17DRAFT_1132569 [Mycena rosella]